MAIQFRIHEDSGGPCCYSTNAAGERIAPRWPCDKCKAHFARLAVRETNDDEYGPYTTAVRAMRAASETPESKAADEFRAARLRDLAAEDATVATLRAAHAARVQPSTDLDRYAPPDPYARDLKALQEAAR